MAFCQFVAGMQQLDVARDVDIPKKEAPGFVPSIFVAQENVNPNPADDPHAFRDVLSRNFVALVQLRPKKTTAQSLSIDSVANWQSAQTWNVEPGGKNNHFR